MRKARPACLGVCGMVVIGAHEWIGYPRQMLAIVEAESRVMRMHANVCLHKSKTAWEGVAG